MRPSSAPPDIVLSDLGLTVSRDYLLLYLKCTGRYRTLAERVLHRRALTTGARAGVGEGEPGDAERLLARFQKDHGLLTEAQVQSVFRDLGLAPGQVRAYLLGRAAHDRMVTQLLAHDACPDHEILLELLFDEGYRHRLVQASVWERVAAQVGDVDADELEPYRARARQRLLATVDLGSWTAYCAELERIGVGRPSVEAFADSVAKVEWYRERGRRA